MNVHQNADTAVIKWGSFDIGGSATVNFTSDAAKFNTLNFVNSGAASQIYGTINADGGNIYVVNPAGVQIGNSAQINVGSLYVSNAELNENALNGFLAGADVNEVYKFTGQQGVKFTNAELMSLGNINANKVTFEGDGRIVIDSERIKDKDGNNNFRVNTNDAGNVIIGYDAYNEGENKGTYESKQKTFTENVYENGTLKDVDGYMWVEDVDQLQAINTNLNGNYALRNSIDATSTEQNGFTSIGLNENNEIQNEGNGFTGKFDGIEYNIFGLNIKADNNTNGTGLFGVTNGATINNVTLVGGSISSGTNVGAVVGSANNTTINNVVNSAAVTGGTNVGGIVGSANGTTVENAINTGAVSGSDNNVGGLIGSMNSSTLKGNSYNLGNVGGVDEGANNTNYAYNVGGLVGYAVKSTIGNENEESKEAQLVYNRLDVTGLYNVGDIVGNMEGSTVQNAENSATVTATGDYTGEYTYHTANVAGGSETKDVYIANVGGIAGIATKTDTNESKIENVTNTGDVSSNSADFEDDTIYYTAGNVGGIVGSAVDTNITNATNQENDVRGAHNVGGVAGYFGGSGTVTNGINDGGDIMATGARDDTGFVTETVRPVSGNEHFIIGNIGGIVGYLDGDGVKVTGSANRGTVHSQDIDNPNNVLDTSKAANVGGVVGKIDTNENNENLLTDFRDGKYENASVSNSYNTGDVRGYTGVGGVVGMMYNGSVAGSYNTGTVNTTRQVNRTGGSNIDPLNMGGVVGDTTEETDANAIIYDVYNKGQIGDETYNFYARHVGGVVGRLSGTLEKAYNNGDIYNNDTTVGGVVGWWYSGNIKNVFNTGNITVRAATELQVGGIVGASSDATDRLSLTNAYNLGTIRGYQESNNAIYVGGIIGRVRGDNTNITNVYTMGNLYAATGTYGGNYTSTDRGLGAIYGYNENLDTTRPTLQGANYIKPASDDFANLEYLAERQSINVIEYGERYDGKKYTFWNDRILLTPDKTTGNVENATDDNWRIYEGETTPILNAFLPNVEEYFGDTTKNNMDGIDSIQYGTAYDPLLTIINANKDLTYDWGELGISGAASLVVNKAGLTINNVDTSAGTGYYAGLLYSQGDLTLNAQGDGVSGDIGFGSEAKLYGSSVKINADGTVTIYGRVTATGEQENSTGNITINAGDVDVYGTLTTGQNTSIAGIANSGSGFEGETNFGNLSNPNEAMVHISDRFAHETTANGSEENIIITAGTKLDANGTVVKDENGNPVTIGGGNVNLYFGNKENGITTTGGNLTVEATGDVYVDSDLDIGGDLTLTGTGENSEVVLDLTNIGQVQADNDVNGKTSTEYLHDFMHHFGKGENDGKHSINLSAEKSGNAKLAVDMWDYEKSEFNLNKFDDTAPDGHTLVDELNNLNINASVIGDSGVIGNSTKARNVTYIWVSNAEQLKGIQEYYTAHKDDEGGTNALTYNYALKNDINASDIEGYTAIGTGNDDGFTGTFDGRGNRIIGLNVTADNAGIFSTIGADGVVKNLNIYSGNFTGTTNAGAVAGENNGRIENITAFGNTVTASGNAGGIVGVNNGSSNFENSGEGASTLTGNGIYDVESTGSVIAGKDTAIAGGLVGTNAGALGNSFSNSAVTSNTGTNAGLGGVVGVNTEKGEVQYVDSLGVTNGGDTGSSNIGGVIGINNGNLYSAYNESIVSGSDNVGGIIGENVGSYDENNKQWTGGVVSNIVNATSVTGIDDGNKEAEDDTAKNGISDNVGGLVGSNSGSVTNGRNNGTITGTNYVGGMVGDNASGAELTDLVNDSSASITGEQYVGGIAGSNYGAISATDTNLINRGSITGQQYVGGVAGENWGTIENTNNDVSLNVKDSNATDDDAAKYFGGVTGWNHEKATIGNATNRADVTAEGASYVGGVAGKNDGTLTGFNGNYGNVIGATNVGGVIGENTTDIEGVEAVNNGTVTATAGGAGGIFGVHTGNIIDSTLENTNEVVGNGDGGTGGIATTNSGKITNSTLINEGKVSNSTGNNVGGIFGIKDGGEITGSTISNNGAVVGKENVGGVFGSNSSTIKTSSIYNSTEGMVIGINNVGGLIGINTGTIEGGRDEANSYYKYQIYNNGVINVGTWTDDNNNGVVDAGEIKDLSEGVTSENIGGLIGNNEGSLTAGYNTGAINAEGSTNVGGIAGSNSGTIDQVFNTVMTADGTNETITGGTNVGGLVGNNATVGELSNAYNTTTVEGKIENAVVGNAVGVNGENANIENVFDVTNTENTLIGQNNGSNNVTGSYTSAATEESAVGTNGITYISSDNKNDKDSYAFTDENTWKFYDGNQTPLLSVFLTKVSIDQDKINDYMSKNKVYNGTEQKLTADDIKKLIDERAIYVEGLTKEEAFEAFNNNTDLISSIGYKDVGNHNDWLYSGQIAEGSQDGSFNPNNLGYDIALTASIDKAKLTINLGEVTHVYGTPTTNGYKYTVEGWVNAADADDYTIDIGTLGNGITDNALKDNNIYTNNVDEYTWTTKATITANGDLNNYEILTVKDGKSIVTPVTVDVTLNDVTHIYGDKFDSTSTDYSVNGISWVNGDSYTNADIVISGVKDNAFTEDGKTNDVTTTGYTWTANVSGSGTNAGTINKNYIFNVSEGKSKVTPKKLTVDDILASIQYGSKGEFTVENTGKLEGVVYDDEIGLTYTGTSIVKESEYAANQNGRDTADVKANNGVYADSISLNGIKLTGEKAGNYYIADTATGDIRVDKAKITIGADNEEIHLGETPNYSGTDIDGVLVNGDSLNGNYHYGVEYGTVESVVGTHTGEIGVWIGNTFYDLSQNVDWTKVANFFSNYEVKYTSGTLTVTDQVLPDLPDNWPSNRWDYLFSDNPFDRNRNFRERKAEVNFVDGGMEI